MMVLRYFECASISEKKGIKARSCHWESANPKLRKRKSISCSHRKVGSLSRSQIHHFFPYISCSFILRDPCLHPGYVRAFSAIEQNHPQGNRAFRERRSEKKGKCTYTPPWNFGGGGGGMLGIVHFTLRHFGELYPREGASDSCRVVVVRLFSKEGHYRKVAIKKWSKPQKNWTKTREKQLYSL